MMRLGNKLNYKKGSKTKQKIAIKRMGINMEIKNKLEHN
jgi:hypothetical protein